MRALVNRRMINDDDHHLQLLTAIENNDSATVISLTASDVARRGAALILSARRGRVKVMAALLDAGADVNAVDEHHQSACDAAALHMHFGSLKLLVDRGASVALGGGALLKLVAGYADDRWSILLLDAGAPLDRLSHDDLIELVVSSMSVAVLTRLLARNVDVSALRCKNRSTVSHHVIRSSKRGEDVCELLRALVHVAGVDVNVVDGNGKTLLHWAATRLNMCALRALVELGADVDCRQPCDGRTPLHLLCGKSLIAESTLFELLFALGADVRVLSHRGQAPTHVAAKFNSAALCACVAAGGDLDQCDSAGLTPRALAAFSRRALPTDADIAAARRRVAKTRLDFVRDRAAEICIGLQSLNLDALQTCEIMMQSFCTPLGALIEFHQWWKIAIMVKHYNQFVN